MCIEENILEYKRQELLCVLYMFFLFINFVKNTSKLNSIYCFKWTRKEQRREEKKNLILIEYLYISPHTCWYIIFGNLYFSFLFHFSTLSEKKIWLKVIDSFTERKKRFLFCSEQEKTDSDNKSKSSKVDRNSWRTD